MAASGATPVAQQAARQGTAARRRAQDRRSTARHLKWVLSLQQAAASHHTYEAGSQSAVSTGSFATVVAELRAEIADLRLQLAALHAADPAIVVGTTAQAGATGVSCDFEVPSQPAAIKKPDDACFTAAPTCAAGTESANIDSEVLSPPAAHAAAPSARMDDKQLATKAGHTSAPSAQSAHSKDDIAAQNYTGKGKKLSAQIPPRTSARPALSSDSALAGARSSPPLSSSSSSSKPPVVAAFDTATASYTTFQTWFMNATEEE